MTELHRRLGSPELAQELPGTLLMKVAMDYVKHLERRNDIEQAKLDQEQVDPLEIVQQPGLPLDMRFEILSDYIEELEGAWRGASEIMETILEEVNQRDGKVVSEVQALDQQG